MRARHSRAASTTAPIVVGPVALNGPCEPFLGRGHDPGREVAHVDDLQLPPRRPRDEQVAAPGDPVRPVCELARRVVREPTIRPARTAVERPGNAPSTAAPQKGLERPVVPLDALRAGPESLATGAVSPTTSANDAQTEMLETKT